MKIAGKMALEDYKDIVSTTATITTIIQFLTGITVCKKFVANGTTGESSSAPFVSSMRIYNKHYNLIAANIAAVPETSAIYYNGN